MGQGAPLLLPKATGQADASPWDDYTRSLSLELSEPGTTDYKRSLSQERDEPRTTDGNVMSQPPKFEQSADQVRGSTEETSKSKRLANDKNRQCTAGEQHRAFLQRASIVRLHPAIEEEIENIVAYERTPKGLRWVRNGYFDVVGGVLIIINALIMCLQLEYNGGVKVKDRIESGAEAKDYEPTRWELVETGFLVSENIFCVIFVLELALRLAAYRVQFFKVAANWLDLIIVAFAVFEMYVVEAAGVALPNLTTVRLLRLVRLTKVVRVMRTLALFAPLRLLVISIISSLGTLVWSMIFLFMIQLICAIFMTQMLYDYIMDDDLDMQWRLEVYEYFGRLSWSLLSMFEVTMAVGTWAKVGRLLIFKVHWMWSVVFAIYGWIVIFAVIRVISAMFLKQTLAAAAADPQNVMAERQRQNEKLMQQLRELFKAADQDDSGVLSMAEFNNLTQQPEVKHMLCILDMDVTEAKKLFKQLASEEGYLDQEAFIEGAVQNRGGAKAVDIAALVHLSTQTNERLRRIHRLLLPERTAA